MKDLDWPRLQQGKKYCDLIKSLQIPRESLKTNPTLPVLAIAET